MTNQREVGSLDTARKRLQALADGDLIYTRAEGYVSSDARPMRGTNVTLEEDLQQVLSEGRSDRKALRVWMDSHRRLYWTLANVRKALDRTPDRGHSELDEFREQARELPQ